MENPWDHDRRGDGSQKDSPGCATSVPGHQNVDPGQVGERGETEGQAGRLDRGVDRGPRAEPPADLGDRDQLARLVGVGVHVDQSLSSKKTESSRSSNSAMGIIDACIFSRPLDTPSRVRSSTISKVARR